nr:MAG TPA: hypothetical protein [Caudoviricetes sp.]
MDGRQYKSGLVTILQPGKGAYILWLIVGLGSVELFWR